MVSIHYLSMFDPIVSLPLSLVNLSSSDPEHVVTCNVTAGHFNHCFSWIAFDKFDYLSDNASPCSLTCPIWDNLGIQAIASNQLCTCSLFVGVTSLPLNECRWKNALALKVIETSRSKSHRVLWDLFPLRFTCPMPPPTTYTKYGNTQC